MKKAVFLLLSIFTLISCSKNKDNKKIVDSCIQNSTTFSNASLQLDIIRQEWYLTRNGDGGEVHLKIKGSTNGDRATIRNYGDGEIGDVEMKLNSNNKFSEDIGISFTATFVPDGDINPNTIIYVYNDTDTLKAELKSCTLRY